MVSVMFSIGLLADVHPSCKASCDTCWEMNNTSVVEKRVVGLTFQASYGEFINKNNTEHAVMYMAACTEVPSVCEILLYFCAYVAKPNLCLAISQFILTLNYMWFEQYQGPALPTSFLGCFLINHWFCYVYVFFFFLSVIYFFILIHSKFILLIILR